MSDSDKSNLGADEANDPWSTPSNSAFSQPRVIDAEDAVDLEDSRQHEEEEQEQQQAAEPVSREGKPNYAILAAVGLMVLLVLGGAGMYVKNRFAPTQAKVREPVVLDLEEVAKAESPPVLAPGQAAASSVFEQPTATASPPSVFDAPNGSAAASAVPAVVAATPATPAALAPSSASLAAATATAPALAAPASKAPVASVAAPVPAPEVQQAESQQKQARIAKAEPTKKETPRPARVASHGTKPERQAKKQPKPKEPREEVILARGLKVQGIFPPAGANVQAWIVDGSGRTQIVRTGDMLSSGVQVTSIVAEKGQVVTTAGIITSSGVR